MCCTIHTAIYGVELQKGPTETIPDSHYSFRLDVHQESLAGNANTFLKN